MNIIEIVQNYALELIFAAITAMLAYGYKRLSNKLKQQAEIKNGIQSILRNSIIASYNKNIDRNFAPIYERENVVHMYESYVSLGGNGVIPGLVKEIMELPTQKEDERC